MNNKQQTEHLKPTDSLGVYTRYAQQGASSRLRYYLYEEYLKKAFAELVFHPLFGKEYLENLYSGNGKSGFLAVRALLKRLYGLLKLEKNLLIEYELCPLLPASLELALISRRKYVLNFDDLVWKKYEKLPFLKNKYDTLISHASGVIAANRFLYDKISALNSNVLFVPTVVDLTAYSPAPVREKKTLKAAWIGTPVTFQACFLPFADTFRQLCSETGLEILVIARKDIPCIPGVNMTCVDWSEKTEGALLNTCDIGIMPLCDDDFSRGKSAYKLIQYAASGLPAIASPVGENRYFIRDGINGFTPKTPAEWLGALRQLEDNSRRTAMALEMQKQAWDYSLQKYGPIVVDFLKKSFS